MLRDYQENVTIRQTDARQSDPYVAICFASDTKRLKFLKSTSTSTFKVRFTRLNIMAWCERSCFKEYNTSISCAPSSSSDVGSSDVPIKSSA